MAANYLVRKGDTYYFRHCVPAAAQHLGKREFIKTLKVSRKIEAIRISREIKIIFDLIIKNQKEIQVLLGTRYASLLIRRLMLSTRNILILSH